MSPTRWMRWNMSSTPLNPKPSLLPNPNQIHFIIIRSQKSVVFCIKTQPNTGKPRRTPRALQMISRPLTKRWKANRQESTKKTKQKRSFSVISSSFFLIPNYSHKHKYACRWSQRALFRFLLSISLNDSNLSISSSISHIKVFPILPCFSFLWFWLLGVFFDP